MDILPKMPIRPENKKKYPKYWKYLSFWIRVGRAKNKCEKCGARNHKPHPKTGRKVTLTVAHIDFNEKNNKLRNLKALCNKCHNSHDVRKRIKGMKKREAVKRRKYVKNAEKAWKSRRRIIKG